MRHNTTRSLQRVAAMLGCCVCAAGFAPAANARPSSAKAIWGPLERDGRSLFPLYRRLGAGIYQMELRWDEVAPVRPHDAADPADAAYAWPARVDYAVQQARANGMKVALQLRGTPRWANGDRPPRWAPRNAQEFGAFAAAASRRFPAVQRWIVWGEPSKRANFVVPGAPTRGRAYQRQVPRTYARLLDAAYAGLKATNRRNLVIGGNTFTVGDIRTRAFVRGMRLPSGRPPRLDLYGHNAFTLRAPDLAKPPAFPGVVDFSDLDTLASLIDANLGRTATGRRIPIYIPEFTLPTDHANWEFNFWVSRRVQAQWLARALAIVRRSRRIVTLGWLSLYDDPPRPKHDEVNRGLLTYAGRLKPSYYAFLRG